MNFTMFEGFFQLLAAGGMVVSGSLFVLGVIYTGYERILLHHWESEVMRRMKEII